MVLHYMEETTDCGREYLVGFEQVDISDDILRIVIFQEMVFKTFRQKNVFRMATSIFRK